MATQNIFSRLFLLTTVAFLTMVRPSPDAFAVDTVNRVSIRSLNRTLSLNGSVSLRASACRLALVGAASKTKVVAKCNGVAKKGEIKQRGRSTVSLGSKTRVTILSNRCELLIQEQSAARISLLCQAPESPGSSVVITASPTSGTTQVNPGATGTPTRVPTVTATNTPIFTPTITATPTEAPTFTPTPIPSATANAQILTTENKIVSINAITTEASPPIIINGSDLKAGDQIVAITRRPRNNLLYALGYNPTDGSVQLYVVSPITGRAQSVSNGNSRFFEYNARIGVDATSRFSMDVNPSTDRIRVVVDNGDNFRINANTGSLIDGNNGGLQGPVEGANKDGSIRGDVPVVDAIAHTNTSITTSNTTLYTISNGLEDGQDKLLIQRPQNEGNQTLITTLSPSFESVFGFDIPAGVNTSADDTPVTSGKAFIGVSRNGAFRLGALDLVTGLIAAPILTPSLGTPISLALNANRVGSYPVMLLSASGTVLTRTTSGSLDTALSLSVMGVVTGENLVGIDYRPGTGQLLGLGINALANTATLYAIDPQTAIASLISTPGGISFVDNSGAPVDFPENAKWGIDVNPRIDRMRVVTSTGLNFRVSPASGIPVDGNSVVQGINPDGLLLGASALSNGVAFTNNFVKPAVTTQYNLDSASGSIYIQTSTELGTLKLASKINDPFSHGFDPLTAIGFDISNDVSTSISNAPVSAGRAVTVMSVGGVETLFEIDLVTGNASRIGTPTVSGIVDLAVGYKDVN